MLCGIANLAPTTYLNQPESDLQDTLCLNATVLGGVGADATGRTAPTGHCVRRTSKESALVRS